MFVDSDPAFTQLAIAKAEPWYVSFFERFDHLFTFGSNIGTDRSPVPTGAFTWHKTWQPITLDDWRTALPPGDRFTSVMTWQIESFTDVGGNKDQEFVKYIDLPSRTPQRFELAINGPQKLLREHGWDTVDAMRVSRTPAEYRDFIQRSRAEFGVAKHTYVATRSGWFSDRTACYLAAGRPALVQDTGWTAHLPSGQGLLAFSSIDEAVAGIDRINTDYARHAACAVEIAREHFDAAQGAAAAARHSVFMSTQHPSSPALAPARTRHPAPGTRKLLRIAHVAPVATTIPPPHSGSVETMTSLLTEGLVARGHDVTLFATGDSTTQARLHAIYPHGYSHDPHMWPWELHELLNLAAAVERAGDFDVIHYEAEYYPMSLAFSRLSPAPLLQTLHYSPGQNEIAALVPVSGGAVRGDLERAAAADARPQCGRHGPARGGYRRAHLPGTARRLPAVSRPVHRRQGRRCRRLRLPSASICALILAAAENDYYRDTVAPLCGRHARSSMPARRITRPR